MKLFPFPASKPNTPGLLAMEDIADGVAREEIELCWVAKITDFEQLQQAIHIEQQEQYGFDIPPAPHKRVVCRVRATTIDGKTEYVFTTKTTAEGEDHPSEASYPVEVGVFEFFKSLDACKGMKKTRYVFQANEAQKWELDVFNNEDGTPFEWCKVDLEFPEGSTSSDLREVPKPPAFLTEMISIKTTDPEKRAFVDDLFANKFSVK